MVNATWRSPRIRAAGATYRRPLAPAQGGTGRESRTISLSAMRSTQAPGVLNRSPSGTPHAAHAANPLRGVCLLCLEHMRHKKHMCLLCLCLELCLEHTAPGPSFLTIQFAIHQHQPLHLDCSVPSHVGRVISTTMVFVERCPQDIWISGQPYVNNSTVQCDTGFGRCGARRLGGGRCGSH
jgi:hypothetical protein